MTRAILVRHGQTTANAIGILAGRTEVDLNDHGREQALALGRRLAEVPLAEAVTSPLLRTRHTLEAILGDRPVPVIDDPDLVEVEYGDWTGRELAELAKDPLWPVVQHHPAAVTFPGGESMAAMSARSVAAVRRRCLEAGEDASVLFVSHGDVIKAILADALGLHLDGFQRIGVNPASVSIVRYVHGRPFIERINDCGGGFEDLTVTATDEAVPGGGKGG